MKRSEFLEQLRKALEHDLNAQQIKEQIGYYDDYISSEMGKGLSEQEVIEQLGDPWAIAKTILLSSKMNCQDEDGRLAKVDKREEGRISNILLAIILVVVLVTIISAAFGIIALVIRYAVPILLVAILIRLFTKK